MMGGGWRHQEAEPSCGFVDESFGPAHALRAVWTARGQRARRALPTACPHSRASRPQLHRTDNHFFSQVVCTTGTHAFDPDQPIGSKSPKSLLTSDASRPIIPSSRKRHPTSTSLATRPISPSLSHWTAGPGIAVSRTGRQNGPEKQRPLPAKYWFPWNIICGFGFPSSERSVFTVRQRSESAARTPSVQVAGPMSRAPLRASLSGDHRVSAAEFRACAEYARRRWKAPS